jgi:malate permease and related proteins
MSTLIVFYAAKGSDQQTGEKAALQTVKKMPMVYGAMGAIAF